MMVDSVRMGTVNTQRVVVLKEKGGERRLSIILSAAEADPVITGLKNHGLNEIMISEILVTGINPGKIILTWFINL